MQWDPSLWTFIICWLGVSPPNSVRMFENVVGFIFLLLLKNSCGCGALLESVGPLKAIVSSGDETLKLFGTKRKRSEWSGGGVYLSAAVLCLSVSKSNYCRSWWKGKQTLGKMQLIGRCSSVTAPRWYTAETTVKQIYFRINLINFVTYVVSTNVNMKIRVC